MQVLVYDRIKDVNVVKEVHKVPFTRVDVNYHDLPFEVDGELIGETLIIKDIMLDRYPISKEALNSWLSDVNFNIAVHAAVKDILCS